ncbi:MAG: IMPACT family protein [Gammaproteobacteria bacterium]
MYCVKNRQTIEDTIKKSRFIGFIAPCRDEQDIMLNLKNLSLEHPHATHIAFAYRLKTEHGLTYRLHDAGEPAGTAGKPIFQHLEGRDLVNVLIAVVRYFGGIKLGAGGLTRAYGNTAKKVIEAADLIAYVEMVNVDLTLEYAQMQRLEYTLKKLSGKIIDQEFAGHIRLSVELPAENLSALLAAFPGSQR